MSLSQNKSRNSGKVVQVEGKAATANHENIPSERLLNLQKLVQRATIYSKFLSAKLVDTESGTNEEMLEKSQPGLLSGATLRDYQIVGFKWLVSLYENGLNGILADEMGLGKTLQTIALLAHLREMGTNGPFLIVAPLSTVSNWIAEFAKFTPTIPTVTYHGDPKVRTSIRAMHMKAKSDSPEFPIVVTSYEICIRDKKYLSKIPWKYIVVDEGHRLKNLDCKLVKELKSYKSANRLLLTGTPLQNNLSELWSLLNFLMPEIFNDLGAFEEWFEWANDLENIEAGSTNLISSLHDILTPFLLRRIKEEVTLDLPKKREYVLYAPMVAKQRELYSAVLRRELATALENNMSSSFSFDHPSSANPSSSTTTIPKQRRKRVRYTERESSDFSEEESLVTINHDEASKKSKNSFIKNLVGRQNLQMMIMQLRKSCNHPYLFHIESENTSNPLVHGVPETLAWSGKMLLLDRLLSALLPKGHKVLIFSQFTSMLNIIQDYLWFVKGFKACRIDGNVKLDERKLEIADFSKTDSNVSVFLLSTRAGGLGINLTAADTVIIFDSDWNPQCDLQAQDRVHRIGQKRPVIVYRLITSNSIEKRILDKARAKRTLERLVIHKAKFKGNLAASAAEEEEEIDIQAILQQEKDSVKSGGVLDGDAEADLLKYLSDPSSIISDQELEEIMDRSDAAYQRFQQRNETTATTVSSQQQMSSFAFREPSVASALELPSPLAQNYTECLSAHNAERSAVGVPSLVWDQNLAQSALQWSIREAQVGQFQFQNNGLGVNNYAATGVQPGNPIIGCVPAVKLWVQQGKPYYIPGSPITQQNYQRVGGFTQVVWSRSVSVGCGTSINPQSAMAFTVCYYSPAGNVLGQAAFDSGIVIPPDSISLN